MPGHHDARDAMPIDMARVILWIMRLQKQRAYGEIRIRMRSGEVVGQVHFDHDLLARELAPVTKEDIAEIMRVLAGPKGVELSP